MENDNICATGRVHSPTEDPLLVQQIIHENQNCILENEFSLGADDIYKDLGIIGYDYSGEFRGLKSIRTNDFQEIHGICKWTGNVVTYLDALLQSMILSAPLRKLMVPVMIRVLRIDPKTLFDSALHYKTVDISSDSAEEIKSLEISSKFDTSVTNVLNAMKFDTNQRFSVFYSEIPFYFNSNSKLLVTHGIEIEGLIAIPIPRKVDVTNLVLDSYEFVLNDDNNAIEDYDRRYINEYLEVRKTTQLDENTG